MELYPLPHTSPGRKCLIKDRDYYAGIIFVVPKANKVI
jgi:hypothetical protein